MVNYNAFNVDPLRYQQAAMGNFQNAMAMRNNEAQRRESNAFNQQQQADLQGQRQSQNAFEAQRIGEAQKRTELERQRIEQAEQQDQFRRWGKAMDIALNAGTTEGANSMLQNIAPAMGLKNAESFSFKDVNPTKSTGVLKTPQGELEITAPTKTYFSVIERMSSDPALKNNPELMGKFLADNGASIKPHTPKEEKVDPFAKKRAEGYAEVLTDINQAIASGTTKNELGETVPLTETDSKRLMFMKRYYENEVNVSMGGKSADLYREPMDVQTAFQAGVISREEARSKLKKLMKDAPPVEPVQPQEEVAPVVPSVPVEKTDTVAQKAYFNSDQAKESGWKALIRKAPTPDERKKAIAARRERMRKSFVRKTPK